MSVELRPSHTIKEQLASSLTHERVVFSAEPLPPSPITGLPDMQRFPDTYGYPAISGGAGEEDTPDKAREFFNRFYGNFDKYIPPETKNKLLTLEEKEEARQMRAEARRLRDLFPDIFAEVKHQYEHPQREE